MTAGFEYTGAGRTVEALELGVVGSAEKRVDRDAVIAVITGDRS
jgi:hypothetical protein